jgi:hypothetical protein
MSHFALNIEPFQQDFVSVEMKKAQCAKYILAKIIGYLFSL